MIGHVSRINEDVLSGPEWKQATFQLSDSKGDVVFKSGVVKRGLGVYSDSFEENGETITDYIITHLWSGDDVIQRQYPFVSEEKAKEMCEDLWAAGANFNVGRQGVLAQRDIILPITMAYVAALKAFWAGAPEGAVIVTIHKNLDPNRN